MQTNYFRNATETRTNGRTVTLDHGMLSLVDEDKQVFTFGYVGDVTFADLENFLWSVDNENDDGAWARGLDNDRDANNSALYQD